MGNANNISSKQADPARQQGKNARRGNKAAPSELGGAPRPGASSSQAAKRERILKGYVIAAATIFIGTALAVFSPLFLNSRNVQSNPQDEAQAAELDYAFYERRGLLTVSGNGPMEDFEYGELSEKLGIDLSAIKEVSIEPGVTSIGAYAFAGCDNLSRAMISYTVASIGDRAFQNCVKLGVESPVELPDSLTSIGDHAFDGCHETFAFFISARGYVQSYAEEHEIPYIFFIEPGATSIEAYEFADCGYLQQVTISDGVTSIGEGAFQNCTNLIPVDLPDSVDSIADDAFDGCGSIVFWLSRASNYVRSYAGDHGFRYVIDAKLNELGYQFSDGSLYIYGDGPIEDIDPMHDPSPWEFYEEGLGIDVSDDIERIIIDSGITSIGNYAFAGCENLSYVSISDSVTSIGEGAFLDCWNLADIFLPDSVTSIGEDAFLGSPDLFTISTSENGLYAQEYAMENGYLLDIQ